MRSIVTDIFVTQPSNFSRVEGQQITCHIIHQNDLQVQISKSISLLSLDHLKPVRFNAKIQQFGAKDDQNF